MAMAPSGWVIPLGYVFSDIGRCSTCAASVAWCITAKGNRAPMNPNGSSHFSTCPTAALHRHRKAEAEPAPLFDGDTYEAERPDDPGSDRERLRRQMVRVKAVLADGGWHTLSAIARRTGDPEASVSARLRDLRKARFGGHIIERRYVERGLFEYRMIEGGTS